MTPTNPEHTYRVLEVVRVVDGDTFLLRVSQGFGCSIVIRCRLNGWDTPEKRKGSVYERAQATKAQTCATTWLNAAMASGFRVYLHTEEDKRTESDDEDDFGRWLGILWWDDASGVRNDLGTSLSQSLLATPWPTRWHEVYDL